VGIYGVTLRLASTEDTLTSSTDSTGKFIFNRVKAKQFSLTATSLGYVPLNRSYSLTTDNPEQALPEIIMNFYLTQLKEVVIKSKTPPIRLLKDTIEFTHEAYKVRDNDYVDDILKQLPGIEIDRNGGVTTGGQMVTKVRVNGKDFFTGNINEYMSKLPANIVDKVQIIDDFGDEANFSGIKSGKSEKMLNVVLKDSINSGNFGSVEASGGTNDRYMINLNGNIWKGSKQLELTTNSSNTSNQAGVNKNTDAGLNYKSKLAENLTLSENYTYTTNLTDLSQETYSQTINTSGGIYNYNNNSEHSKGGVHNIDLNIQSTSGKTFISGNLRGTLSNIEADNSTSSMLYGIIRQDLITNTRTTQNVPNLNGSFSLARRLKKPEQVISIGFTANVAKNHSVQNQNNSIAYFDSLSNFSIKDSVRNQFLNTSTSTNVIGARLVFTEPLRNSQDSTSHKYLDFLYSFAYSGSLININTKAGDRLNYLKQVDSLTSNYRTAGVTQTIGLTYRYTEKHFNYSFGINAQPTTLNSLYSKTAIKTSHSEFIMFPAAQMNFRPSSRHSLNILYNGTNTTPSLYQLQPLPDTRNIQNTVIGNQNLKSSFNHTLNLTYNTVNMQSSKFFNLTASKIQNKIVSNTVLVADTLNTLKQQTSYVNSNGYYSFGGNYLWSIRFSNMKYNLDLQGGVNYSHQVAFANSIENASKQLGFNQAVTMRVNLEWIRFNTSINYINRTNSFSLGTLNFNVVRSWLFNTNIDMYFSNTLMGSLLLSKSINRGYSISNENPFIINAEIQKKFFNNKRAALKLAVNDLLNQGNVLERSVLDNTISERKSNQVTKYFSISVSWKLEKFFSE